MNALYILTTTGAATLAMAALAQDYCPTGNPPRPPGGKGPPEAMVACQGKAAGEKTSITHPDSRVITGSCQLMFQPDRSPAK